MLICDAHCDLPSKGAGLYDNGCDWDLKRLPSGSFLQVFAHYVDASEVREPFLYIDSMLKDFKSRLGDVGLALTGADIGKLLKEKRAVAVLGIEGGEALGGHLENLDYFYGLGVRILGLTWNHKNQLGFGVGAENQPLTELGKKAVLKMEKLGMIVDVSHLSEAGFYDVAELSKRPFMASHSNSYSECPHRRNLTDAQFLLLAEAGGVCGINLYPYFLTGTDEADISDIMRHIEHFLGLGGEDTLCLGTDFDGIDAKPRGFDGPEALPELAEEMLRLNYPEDLVLKIMGGNLQRFLEMTMVEKMVENLRFSAF